MQPASHRDSHTHPDSAQTQHTTSITHAWVLSTRGRQRMGIPGPLRPVPVDRASNLHACRPYTCRPLNFDQAHVAARFVSTLTASLVGRSSYTLVTCDCLHHWKSLLLRITATSTNTFHSFVTTSAQSSPQINCLFSNSKDAFDSFSISDRGRITYPFVRLKHDRDWDTCYFGDDRQCQLGGECPRAQRWQ